MDKTGKKAVRFSSPFEISTEDLHRNQKHSETSLQRDAPKFRKDKTAESDSWDAFDAKMLTAKDRRRGPVFKDACNQFLELNSTQNKSLNIADEDFSVLSFQDAKDLIDRDENDRLKFLNSNISFTDGIEQMEAPSLLSVTSYFQQGSSFPVPYIGNDSTMMFGESRSEVLPVTPNDVSQSRHTSNVSSQHLLRQKDPSYFENTTDLVSQTKNNSYCDVKRNLSRKDSFAKFFLGPQSDGLNKMDIMDYVLDYCKRRASLRSSNESDIETSPSLNISSRNVSRERHDSGIGGDERTAANNKEVLRDQSDKGGKQHILSFTNTNANINLRTDANTTKATVNDKEESVIIADGASMKDKDNLNVSDVASIDGFEKFKKNLNTRRKNNDEHRYRGKAKYNEDFESKRLNIDELNSHPKLNTFSFNGQGSTTTLECPTKKIQCRSPPEKLVRSKVETDKDNTPSNSLLETQVLSSKGQCHSTPVAVHNETSTTKIEKQTLRRKDAKMKPSNFRTEKPNDVIERKMRKRYVPHQTNSHFDEGNNYLSDTSVQSDKEMNNSERHFKRITNESRNKITDKQIQIDPTYSDAVDSKISKTQSKLCDPIIQHNTLKPCEPSYRPPHQSTQVLQEQSSVVPTIHSTVSQQQCQVVGNPPCACPHQYMQQTAAQGVFPGLGLPIVIHIHLPSTTSATGTVVHPVPATSNENQKM